MARNKRVDELTEAQEKALRVISKMQGCSLDEWAKKMNLTYGTIVHHRRNLERKGYLTATPGKARTTRLTKKAQQALGMEVT